MKRLLISSTITFVLTTIANADFIGAEVGYATWGSSLKGDIRKGNDSLDFEKDLGYGKKEVNNFIWAYIDHPIPILPNLKVQYTSFSNNSSGTIQDTTIFNDTTLIKGSSNTSISLYQIDIIPYWRILDNWVNLDIGLNFKAIDGNIKIKTISDTSKTDFSLVLPMIYGKVRFDLPLTGLSIEADASYITYDGNKFSDIKANLVYETTFGLGTTAGYKQQNIMLDDINDTYGKLNIEGAYIGVFYHF